MKHVILLVLVMLLGVQAFGQKKKSKDELAAMQLDSLTQANSKLMARSDSMDRAYTSQTVQLDSVRKELVGHELMYTAVKEKVMKADFDPARTGVLIDSLKTNRDKSVSGLTKETKELGDTLSVLRETNTRLKATLADWEGRAANNEQVVRDLEQLKSLYDQKVLTQAEFDQRRTKLLAKWR